MPGSIGTGRPPRQFGTCGLTRSRSSAWYTSHGSRVITAVLSTLIIVIVRPEIDHSGQASSLDRSGRKQADSNCQDRSPRQLAIYLSEVLTSHRLPSSIVALRSGGLKDHLYYALRPTNDLLTEFPSALKRQIRVSDLQLQVRTSL